MARSGDAAALEALFQRHRDRVFRVALRMTGDHEVAEDVTQDAFVQALRKLPSLRNGQAFGAWVLRIATRVSLRRKGRNGDAPAIARDTDVPTPEHLALAAERVRCVEAALARVPARHRALLVLRDVEDLSYAEIAEVLGCSVASVKVRLSRARAIFRDRAGDLLA